MSYKELIARRAERDIKEQAKAEGKVKRGQKSSSPEAEEIVTGNEIRGRKLKSMT